METLENYKLVDFIQVKDETITRLSIYFRIIRTLKSD
jgi:hypothetical protein